MTSSMEPIPVDLFFKVQAVIDAAVAVHRPSPPDRHVQRPYPVQDYFSRNGRRYIHISFADDLVAVNPMWDSIRQFLPVWRQGQEVRYLVLTPRIGDIFMQGTRHCYPGYAGPDAPPDLFYKNNCAPSFHLGLLGHIGGVSVIRGPDSLGSLREGILAL